MRTLLAAVSALAVLTACETGHAADKGGPAPMAPAGVMLEEGSVHDGAYIGITAGYSAAVFEAEKIDLGSQGAFGGGYIGFGRVMGGVYYGLEVDGMLTDIRGTVAGEGFSITGKNDWIATARARVGLPIGPALAYATAGPAFASGKLSLNGVPNASQTETMVGLAAGGGLQLALTKNMHARLEGIYYAFPDQDFSFAGDKITIDQSATVVRAGLGWKF